MKKVLTYVTLLMTAVGMFLFFNISAQAVTLNIYNGDNVPAGTGYGSCNDAWRNGFCRYGSYRGTRISIVYYDGSGYEVLKRSIDVFPKSSTLLKGTYYYDQHYNNKVALSSHVTVAPSRTDEITTTKNSSMFNTDYFRPVTDGNYIYTVLTGMPTDGNSESAYWKKIFLQDTVDAQGKIIEESVGNQLIKLIRGDGNLENGASLSDGEAWAKPSEEADPNGDITKIGYRILIEPLYIWAGQKGSKDTQSATKDGKYYVMTPTEYASLVWNTGSYTGAMQVNWYLYMSERLITSFDDIGISKTIACTDWSGGNKCFASDVQFPGSGRKGHALNIIDITKVIEKSNCNYETGEGFPKDKVMGDPLTDEEKECCEEQIEKIKSKYKGAVTTPQQCMLTSNSVTAYINCMDVYFRGVSSAEQLWEQEKQELLEFNQKYPACSSENCDFQELILIEQSYSLCVSSLNIIDWMNNILVCRDTTCEVNYKSALVTYKQNHLLCDLDEWEAKIPTHGCTPIPSGCDEDNPNHFPDPTTGNYDKNCCLYFEEKMKTEYKAQGLSEAEINQKINEWFYEPGKEFRLNCLVTTCDLNDTTLTEECCEILMKAHPEITDKNFWESKGCAYEENPKCTWTDYGEELVEHLHAMATANCAVGDSSKLESSDTTNWECIYESDNIKEGTKEEVFRDYYVKYSNPYCAVYCREDVKYDFPDGSMIVNAGYHFTVGVTGHEPEWKNVKFASTRECKTQGSTTDNDSDKIDQEKFEKDWNDANNKVIRTWDSWKIAEDQLWSAQNATYQGQCGCCCSGPSCGCTGPCGSFYRGAITTYGTFFNGTVTIQVSWCTAYISTQTLMSNLSRGVKSTNDSHVTAKHDMETVETDIHACTDWREFDSYRYATFSYTNIKATRYAKYSQYDDMVKYYEFNPDLTINYDEPTHDEYDYNDLLKKYIDDTVISDNNFSTTGAKFTTKYKCPPGVAPNLKTCEKVVTFIFSSQTEAHSTYYKEINYTLQDGVFNTILKPQGTAVHDSEVGSSSKQIYIDLGYSALHVHFMTPTGRYDSDLTYPGFTPHATTTSQFEHNFDKLVGDQYLYDCTYQVFNEIIENDDPNCVGDNCEPCQGNNCKPCAGDNCSPASLRGLNLIYRPISLENPFPGIDGTGRDPGSNWNDSTLINNFISQNRGVSGSSIYYEKQPMYQITLTPALINKIREYNETTTYNDFNMECQSDGTECKSQFIRGTLENATYNFSANFQTCKNSIGGSTVCCGIGNWNDCDNADGITRR